MYVCELATALYANFVRAGEGEYQHKHFVEEEGEEEDEGSERKATRSKKKGACVVHCTHTHTSLARRTRGLGSHHRGTCMRTRCGFAGKDKKDKTKKKDKKSSKSKGGSAEDASAKASKSKKRGRDSSAGEGVSDGGAGSAKKRAKAGQDESGAREEWEKAVVKKLRKAPKQTLKLSVLRKRVFKAVDGGEPEIDAARRKEFLATLRKMENVKIKASDDGGKMVKLKE